MMEKNLHHHDLVKSLNLDEQRKINDTWEYFLARNNFEEPQE
jgi:hypothetical protein